MVQRLMMPPRRDDHHDQYLNRGRKLGVPETASKKQAKLTIA